MNKPMEASRRSFLRTISLGGVALLALPFTSSGMMRDTTMAPIYKILFQGDSITDGNRGRSNDPNHIMGHGYAFSIASRLGADFPERNLRFVNRGISGNTLADLAARWKQDTLLQAPDVVSILVGVNDVYFRIKDNIQTPDNFEERYRQLLDQTKAALPEVALVLGEPFILPVGMVKNNLEQWTAGIQERQQITRKLAADYNAVFVAYQDVFRKACDRAAADYWIWDGIHPTVAGHELMAREWIDSAGKRLPLLQAK